MRRLLSRALLAVHAAPSAVALAACVFTLPACSTLATSPEWVGGGLITSAPIREAEEEAASERERRRLASQPQKIGARHVLIMHKQSKSRADEMTRSRDEAKKLAQEVLLQVRGGAKFEELVAKYSDEPGAGERGGDLGVFDRNTMVKSFSDAAFSLKVGEISEVVESPFGFHIIQRTE
ncbi:peptidylprolyl isomerase [Chondromyces crocatus]|uniref:Peptidyl-prolyl cis-trans isomerase n=1 Tax=Chondromyces crocatus TaxID=52 RepID=A0A0K1E895_CHOCO|nr:peptidylprolyl isomerase [Chondromyces crocatus]AKT37069.1 peptidyl-prolyl cis-trans isomerase [Chondromyces crocatus]